MIFHNRKTFSITLSTIFLIILFFSNPQSISMQSVDINHVYTAWMIVPITIVLLTTPSLTFFYSGITSSLIAGSFAEKIRFRG